MIEVSHLTRVFRTYKKQPGFLGGVRGLFRRDFEETRAADDISFSIAEGEFVGFLGPNGAGKTTTLRLLLGLSAPDGGQIHMLGHAIPQHARAARQHIGVVPQLDNLDPDFSVAENLLVYGRYFGLGDALIRSRIPELQIGRAHV